MSTQTVWQSDVAHWQAGGLGHSTHFNVTTTAMAPRQLLSQPHCRDGPGTRSWAEYGAAAHARCVAPTLDHFGANSGQKRPGIRPAWLGHGAPRERQRHRSVRRTKTAYFSHCGGALGPIVLRIGPLTVWPGTRRPGSRQALDRAVLLQTCLLPLFPDFRLLGNH